MRHSVVEGDIPFLSIEELAKEYDSIIEFTERLRKLHPKQYRIWLEQLSTNKVLTTTEKVKIVEERCKKRFNPIFKRQHERMQAYSRKCYFFFHQEENRSVPEGFNFFKLCDLKKSWTYWIYSFSFFDFSPFEKKIRVQPIDTSRSEEDVIMNALSGGYGDVHGFD